jgi:hypothetical protein
MLPGLNRAISRPAPMERAPDFDNAILEAAPVAENGFLEYVAPVRRSKS